MPPGSSTNGDPGRFTEVELTTRDATSPLVGLSAELDCYVEVLETIRLIDPGEPLRGFLRVCDRRAERVRRAEREYGPVEEVTVLGEFDEELLVEMTVGECVLRTVERTPTILSVAEADAGEGRMSIVISPTDDLGDVVGPLFDAHEGIEVAAIRDRDIATPLLTGRGLRTMLEENLTDRQWEALRAAYLEEYFGRPRETTQGELAEAMGITQETFSQHLRTAEHKLLALLFEEGAFERPGR